MTAVILSAVAGVGFAGSSILAMRGDSVGARLRNAAIAVAAGMLLALAFADLFPESVEVAGDRAVAGVVAGFALLFLVEALTDGHTHHAPGEEVHRHAFRPFVLGLAIHNVADGFTLGVGEGRPRETTVALTVGVIVHQVPVGLSLAAVFAAARAPRRVVVRWGVVLGSLIPAATVAALVLPFSTTTSNGVLTGVAAGVLIYVGSTHLLPQAQAEHPNRSTALVFAVTLVVTTAAIFTVLAE